MIKSQVYYFLTQCYCRSQLFEDRLRPNIGFILRGDLAVFTRSAITAPKLNRFGWNLKHSEYIVGGSDSLRGRRNFLFIRQITPDFDRRPSFTTIWTQQRRSVRRWKLSEQNNFKNVTVRGRFSKKTQKFLSKFQRLATSSRHNYAVITDRRKFTTK